MNSKVPKDKWTLLHHIPTLQELDLQECDYLASVPESMRHLTSLRSLSLSSCNSISVLPEWMGDLTSLESLQILRCPSMKSLPQCAQQLTMLKKLEIWDNPELRKWCESEDNRMKLFHIEDISYSGCDSVGDSSPKNDSVSLQLFMSSNLRELQISCLEGVRFLEEARKIKLLDRQRLSKLTLEWTSDDDRILEDEAVLGELVPPGRLKHLKLDGYSSISFPTWLMGISRHLPNLVEIKLENLPRCNNLPPLGQLRKLKELHLRRLHSITKIDGDLCGGRGAFLQLLTLDLDDMENLEEWNTTYCGEDGMEEFMFPKLYKLDIVDCPKLRLTPRPPIFRSWKIERSDEVISSWSEGGHVSHSPSDTPGTTLIVRSSQLPMGEWRLLHHLPTLQKLMIFHCDILMSLPENIQHLVSLQRLKLSDCGGILALPEWLGHLTSLKSLYISKGQYIKSLPENMQHLASLQSLGLSDFYGISALPEWLGHLTSLESLHIYRCQSIKSLPQCIQQLTKLKKLKIVDSPGLKKWCESEDNKMKLAHIKVIVEDPSRRRLHDAPFRLVNR